MPGGPWRTLLAQAFGLIDELSQRGLTDPFWTLGGGTLLMLRYQYRRSKGIDIFVPDPQCLGYMTLRLSDQATAGPAASASPLLDLALPATSGSSR